MSNDNNFGRRFNMFIDRLAIWLCGDVLGFNKFLPQIPETLQFPKDRLRNEINAPTSVHKRTKRSDPTIDFRLSSRTYQHAIKAFSLVQ